MNGFSITDVGDKRILIVEDKKLNQVVANEMLHSWWPNIVTDIAENGRIAVEMLQQRKFDIVLMDVQMPEMDGFEFLEQFKKLPKSITDVCKVAMLSSTLDFGDIKRAEANPYVIKLLKKPLSITDLQAIL